MPNEQQSEGSKLEPQQYAGLPDDWARATEAQRLSLARRLPLRRNTQTLLKYLEDTRVTGTSTQGNLPLKAVREIAVRFIDPPALERRAGGTVYPVRSEQDLRLLYFVRILSAGGGLLQGGPGRRWKVTPLGEWYLAAGPQEQVWHLFCSWWVAVDWSQVWGYALEAASLERLFRRQVLESLLALPVDAQRSFANYAQKLIDQSAINPPVKDEDLAGLLLQTSVEKLVVDPLAAFGVLKRRYQPSSLLGERNPELAAIQITGFGRSLLEAITEHL